MKNSGYTYSKLGCKLQQQDDGGTSSLTATRCREWHTPSPWRRRGRRSA
uniref:Uncharacterized protein n=1 Tax=Setaria viridis TaxID=4556 RepID=A0A4U6VVM5_SETVI|nr:hypothetical protein SEVIR_2G273400v2 [Setaria viridis]